MTSLPDEWLTSVARLVELIQEVVESNFVAVTVEGEVSNFSMPASGHWYFTLKDARAQLRAVMFRGRNRLCRIRPGTAAGDLQRQVSVYTSRGEVAAGGRQADCRGARHPAGGLRGSSNSVLPPRGCSLTGASGRCRPSRARSVSSPQRPAPRFTICSTCCGAGRPGCSILLRPVKVQGDGAAEEIAAAIADLNRHGQVDVLIVGRGGGSLEGSVGFQ